MKNIFIIIFLLIILIIATLFYLNRVHSSKIMVPPDNKIYFCAFPDFGGEENIVTKERIKNFEQLSGKKIAWAPFSQHWFQGMVYPKKSIHTIWEMGIVPYIRLLPRSNLTQYNQEKQFSLDNIIAGKFDKELKKWAEDSKKDNIPIIVDFALEMNGDWFGWSGALNGADKKDGYGDKNEYDGPEKYRDAYKHIIDLFRKKNIYHVTWFFHPTILSTPNEEWNSPKNYYPGDDYIDWIGISIYGAFHPKENYWDSFDEILEMNYKKILEISKSKPLAIVELGVTDYHPMGRKSKWIKDAFKTILTQKYLDFKAITYWHENWDNDGSLTSLRIDSSFKSLKTFRDEVKSDRFISKCRIIE